MGSENLYQHTSHDETSIQKLAEPVHVTITRNAKGKVQYEFSVHAATPPEVELIVGELEKWVQDKFKGQLAGEEATERLEGKEKTSK